MWRTHLLVTQFYLCKFGILNSTLLTVLSKLAHAQMLSSNSSQFRITRDLNKTICGVKSAGNLGQDQMNIKKCHLSTSSLLHRSLPPNLNSFSSNTCMWKTVGPPMNQKCFQLFSWCLSNPPPLLLPRFNIDPQADFLSLHSQPLTLSG